MTDASFVGWHACAYGAVLSERVSCRCRARITSCCHIPSHTGGIYVRLRDEFGMPEPECMFDMDYFRANPQIFYSFAHELWPGNHVPTRSHQFIKSVEEHDKVGCRCSCVDVMHVRSVQQTHVDM